nr:Hypothetical protein CBG02561 [Haemonchus contortus]
MRLAILAISLLAVAYATPVVISEERVNAILEKLRRAHAIGEFAVNTPTGIYPIKDINKNNFRQIFNFAPLTTKEGETTEVENHKAVADSNIDEKLTTSDKDQHAPVAEGKEVADKSTAVTEQAKSTEVTEEKSAEASKEKATAETSTYAEKPETTKAVEESSSHAEKIETTEAAGGAAEATAKVESKEVTEAKSAEGSEVSSTATVVTETSSLEATGEHAAEAKSSESEASASGTSTEKAGATSTVVDAKAGGEEAASRVGETTPEAHGEEGATKTLTAGHAEASFVKEGEAGTVAADKVEGSGDVHEGSGTLEDTPSPLADTTTLLTGNSQEASASMEGQAHPTITIPQNPEEPYIYVPVESYKGHNLPKVSYLLIPKKYESEISEYLTAKTH